MRFVLLPRLAYYTATSGNTYLKKELYEASPYYAGYKYGPSSNHPGVVNHLFADGSVHGISVDIDTSTYMFLLTRSGGETIDATAVH